MRLFQFHHIITKTTTILLLISTSILLTGCWDRREVNDTAYVVGAAIDKAKGKKIKVTIQILVPRGVSSGQQTTGGGGGSTSPIAVREAIGENMADAASMLQKKVARKIFWGHCKAFIFGEELAKVEGIISTQIDYIFRHPEPRERAYMFISKGEASKLMKLMPPLDIFIGESLRKITEEKIGATVTVKDFEQMLTGDTKTAFLPLIHKLPAIEPKHSNLTIANFVGTAIFKKDKMIGQIDMNTTRGLLWLRNEGDVSSVTVNTDKEGLISIDPVRQKTKYFPFIKNGKWTVLAKVTTEGTVVQNGTPFDMMSPEIIKKLEKKVEKDIKQRINQSLSQVKTEMNIDAFGFADAFHRKYPKEWGKVKDRWEQFLPQVEVKVAVKTNIRRPGLSTTPAGVPEKEVKKK